MIGDVLVVEPGSPLDTRFTSVHSYALLRLGDEIAVEFVVLD
jgi:predicted phosphodiesterase